MENDLHRTVTAMAQQQESAFHGLAVGFQAEQRKLFLRWEEGTRTAIASENLRLWRQYWAEFALLQALHSERITRLELESEVVAARQEIFAGVSENTLRMADTEEAAERNLILAERNAFAATQTWTAKRLRLEASEFPPRAKLARQGLMEMVRLLQEAAEIGTKILLDDEAITRASLVEEWGSWVGAMLHAQQRVALSGVELNARAVVERECVEQYKAMRAVSRSRRAMIRCRDLPGLEERLRKGVLTCLPHNFLLHPLSFGRFSFLGSHLHGIQVHQRLGSGSSQPHAKIFSSVNFRRKSI